MSPPSAMSRVSELMTPNVLGVEPGMRVCDALELAEEHHVTHFPIVQYGQTLGVVCTCDLHEAALSSDVSSIMHVPAATVEVGASVKEAARLMAERGVGSLVVLAKSDIVGILTRSDIERAGLGEVAFGEQRCSACGTYQHVRLDEKCGYWLCTDCRNRAHGDDADLGGGD